MGSIAAGVSCTCGLALKPNFASALALDHASKLSCTEGRAALERKDEGPLPLLLALELP